MSAARRARKNKREKERRMEVSDRFDELADIVGISERQKANKVAVLTEAVRLITSMRAALETASTERQDLRNEVANLTACIVNMVPQGNQFNAYPSSHYSAAAAATAMAASTSASFSAPGSTTSATTPASSADGSAAAVAAAASAAAAAVASRSTQLRRVAGPGQANPVTAAAVAAATAAGIDAGAACASFPHPGSRPEAPQERGPHARSLDHDSFSVVSSPLRSGAGDLGFTAASPSGEARASPFRPGSVALSELPATPSSPAMHPSSKTIATSFQRFLGAPAAAPAPQAPARHEASTFFVAPPAPAPLHLDAGASSLEYLLGPGFDTIGSGADASALGLFDPPLRSDFIPDSPAQPAGYDAGDARSLFAPHASFSPARDHHRGRGWPHASAPAPARAPGPRQAVAAAPSGYHGMEAAAPPPPPPPSALPEGLDGWAGAGDDGAVKMELSDAASVVPEQTLLAMRDAARRTGVPIEEYAPMGKRARAGSSILPSLSMHASRSGAQQRISPEAIHSQCA